MIIENFNIFELLDMNFKRLQNIFIYIRRYKSFKFKSKNN